MPASVYKEYSQQARTIKKDNSKLFFDLKKKLGNKKLSKEFRISERTLKSYYQYFLTGKSQGKNDRVPPKKLLDKIKVKAKSKKIPLTYKAKMVNTKEGIKGKDIIGKHKLSLISKEIRKHRDKFKGVFVRLHLDYFVKGKGMQEKWITITLNKFDIPPVTNINNKISDYLNLKLRNSLSDYNEVILFFEIKEINIQLIKR